MAVLVLGVACGSPKLIPAGVEATTTAPTTTELITTTTEPATTTTTTEPTTEVQVSRVIPVPTTTAKYLQGEATTDSACAAIPAYIVSRESGCQNIPNDQGSGCDGYYQICQSTWDNYDGYPDAMSAPKSVQDAKAAELWDNGNGCSHWNAC